MVMNAQMTNFKINGNLLFFQYSQMNDTNVTKPY